MKNRFRSLQYTLFALCGLSSIGHAAPPEIKAVGNHLEVKATPGSHVRLIGVNMPSMHWGPGEDLTPSTNRILNTWKANVIRLALNQSSWLSSPSYQATVDALVNQVSAANGYIILDNHDFGQPDGNAIPFWTSVAGRSLYKNNPAVIFGLFNEAHGISWGAWRDGDANGPGLQDLLETVRSTGANNLVSVGGLKYASDISGILSGQYALVDTSTGNGIMYESHIYSWHGWTGWVKMSRVYPMLIGECGNDGSGVATAGTSFGGNSPFLYWQMLANLNALGANFTAWSFHARGGPSLITETGTTYTPLAASGQFVMSAILSERDPAHASKLLNSGFETPVASTVLYRPSGANWSFTGNSGVQKTWNPAHAPGHQTAFLQTAAASDTGSNGIDGSLTQTVNFASTGTYTISFLIAQRSGKTPLPIIVSVDGVPISSVAHTPTDALNDNAFNPVVTAPFTINAVGNHIINLAAEPSPGIARETMIDNITVLKSAPAIVLDEGFQVNQRNNGTFAYRPTGSEWTFLGNAGVERNALGAPTAPIGVGVTSSGGPQAAFLQTAEAVDAGENNIDGTISQDIEFAAPGAYSIKFKAATRSGKGNLPIQVLVDGAQVGTITPVTTAFADYATPAFQIRSPGYHTVKLAATPGTADNEAFIDGVTVTVPAASFTRPTPVPVGNAGFETPSSATTTSFTAPTGTPWTFAGRCSVSSDLSGSQNYDGRHSPEGWHKLTFQGDGNVPASASQSIHFSTAGSYVVYFNAQKGRNGGVPLTVYVDGVAIGTHTPPRKGFLPYTTPPFSVAAGAHTIKIECPSTLSGTGVFTLIDAVSIWPQAGPDPDAILFQSSQITSYDTTQDGQSGLPSAATVSPGGTSVTLTGNCWKKIPLTYTVTPNTVLEVTVNASDSGEVFGIALDNNTAPTNTPKRAFRFGGSHIAASSNDSWSWAFSPVYGTGAGPVTYVIPVGNYFTGSVAYLGFFADDDSNGSSNVTFSDVILHE